MIAQIETIDLLKMASGDILSLQVYKFVGRQPGKKVYIQANLHGAEIVGNSVIQRLISDLLNLDQELLQGEIWLVPVCNPLGTNQRGHFFATGRFNNYDGKNWNRIFWDYEKENDDLIDFAKSQLDQPLTKIRANYLAKIKAAWQKQLAQLTRPRSSSLSNHYRAKLQSLCLDADYVIDIHSSSNQALDFLFCFQSRETSAHHFLIDFGILMSNYDGDAFDEAFLKPWLALEQCLQQLGREARFDVEAWTLELGSGMAMNPQSVEKGVQGINNYLYHKQILAVPTQLQNWVQDHSIQFVQRRDIHSYYAQTGGMVQNCLTLGTQVNQGDRLYQILSFNKQGQLPKTFDVYSETRGIVFDVATNPSVNQGEYVIDVLQIK